MLYLFILINTAWASAIQITVDDTSAFGAWISVLVSRGVYVVLASLIAICLIITTVKNKLERKAARNKNDDNKECWATDFWKKSNPLPSDLGQRSNDTMCDRIKEAEVTITSLKAELDMANKFKIDLENTLELYERQKNSSEDEVIRLKKDGAMDLEALKKEASINERKLQNALEERDSLAKEVESLKREGRITESAIKDQVNLTKKLEKARTDIESLKIKIKDMKSERDLAVKLASDVIEKAKGIATRDKDQRRVVERMIETEVKKLKLEEDDKDKNEIIIEEPYSNIVYEKDFKILDKKRDQVFVLTEADLRIDDPSIITVKTDRQILIASPGVQEEYSNENIDSLEEDDEDKQSKFLTGSPAFQAFINSLTQANNND